MYLWITYSSYRVHSHIQTQVSYLSQCQSLASFNPFSKHLLAECQPNYQNLATTLVGPLPSHHHGTTHHV